tara:strand:+ start:350 stop:574 length:225 start_codon:yes stop_codon:yes gene_type:complete
MTKKSNKNGDTLVEPKQSNPNVAPISQEILDIYNKLDWSDKRKIPVEEYQKAYFKQQELEKQRELKYKNRPQSA